MKISFILTALLALATSAQAKSLKVFILAGQSNMQGHAKVETFDYIGDDPATASLLKDMRGADGNPVVCKRTWISYLTDNEAVKEGRLTAGYGALGSEPKIGPEFTFGITMEKAYDGPILIIKTAWGGKSLHTDFRPPSAGTYEMTEFQLKNYPKQEGHGIPKDFEKWKADKIKETGHYYGLMVGHVRKVLQDLKSACPDYNPAEGYELAGFVWFQGWNDLCDNHTYPEGDKPGGYDLYSTLLAHFIRDVRKEFNVPKLPFVIGVLGVEGAKANRGIMNFREAMAAPTAMPEFQGNAKAVQTAPFWDQKLGEIDGNRGKISQMEWMLNTKNINGPNKDGTMTKEDQVAYLKEYRAKMITPEDEALWNRGASNAGYHYLGCSKTFALMGRAFAEAQLSMMKK